MLPTGFIWNTVQGLAQDEDEPTIIKEVYSFCILYTPRYVSINPPSLRLAGFDRSHFDKTCASLLNRQITMLALASFLSLEFRFGILVSIAGLECGWEIWIGIMDLYVGLEYWFVVIVNNFDLEL